VIATKYGKLQGGEIGGVNAYRGIPFAAPPVGELRWRDPKAPASWTGIKAATKYSPACNEAEDCLYLNVWTPPDAKPATSCRSMSWIHGGPSSSAPAPGSTGPPFAKKGVVVVSVNYRLGRLGFFSHPALTARTRARPATTAWPTTSRR
jgi:para-nitrobenzyl esterase